MTNADWIRSFSNDKLAEFIYGVKYGDDPNRFDEKKEEFGRSSPFYKYLLEWLESERDTD